MISLHICRCCCVGVDRSWGVVIFYLLVCGSGVDWVLCDEVLFRVCFFLIICLQDVRDTLSIWFTVPRV